MKLCEQHAIKFAKGFVQELLKSNPDTSVELRSLSIMIAINSLSSNMSDNDKSHFASNFRQIANQLEDGVFADKSFLSAFFGKEVKDMKNKSNDIV
jgi:hypothetical protein